MNIQIDDFTAVGRGKINRTRKFFEEEKIPKLHNIYQYVDVTHKRSI